MLQKLRNSKHSLTLIKPNEEIILLNNTFFKNPDKFLVLYIIYIFFLICIKEMKKILEKGTGKRSDKDLYFLATYLKYNVFFLNLVQTKDYSTLEQCFRNMQIEYHPKFTFIFQFGQKGEKFYIILKGEAQLMLPKDNSFNDKENIVENMIKIKLLNVGNSFGELALFSNKTRTASIYTTQDCYLAVLSKKDFKKILC